MISPVLAGIKNTNTQYSSTRYTLQYARTRSYLVLVRTCVPGRLLTYSSMHLFFVTGGLIHQGPCYGIECAIRIVWCIWVVLLETQVREQCHFFVLDG